MLSFLDPCLLRANDSPCPLSPQISRESNRLPQIPKCAPAPRHSLPHPGEDSTLKKASKRLILNKVLMPYHLCNMSPG